MTDNVIYVVRCGCTSNPFLVTKDYDKAKNACDSYLSGSTDKDLNGAFIDKFIVDEKRTDPNTFDNIYQSYENINS